MKKMAICLALGCLYCPSDSKSEPRLSSTCTLEVRAIVPASCHVELQESRIEGSELVMRTVERCNTQRELKISENRLALAVPATEQSLGNNLTKISGKNDISKGGEPPILVSIAHTDGRYS